MTNVKHFMEGDQIYMKPENQYAAKYFIADGQNQLVFYVNAMSGEMRHTDFPDWYEDLIVDGFEQGKLLDKMTVDFQERIEPLLKLDAAAKRHGLRVLGTICGVDGVVICSAETKNVPMSGQFEFSEGIDKEATLQLQPDCFSVAESNLEAVFGKADGVLSLSGGDIRKPRRLEFDGEAVIAY